MNEFVSLPVEYEIPKGRIMEISSETSHDNNNETIDPPSYQSIYPDNPNTNSDNIIIYEQSSEQTRLDKTVLSVSSVVLISCALVFPPKALLFSGLSLVALTLAIL